MLMRALGSVLNQSRPADQIIVSVDNECIGSAANRNRALESATSDWVAFLDDDDELFPTHLEHLLAHAEETGADLVYPWFEGINAEGIFTVPEQSYAPESYCQIVQVSPEGKRFDGLLEETIRTTGNFIPVTVLVRRELIQSTGGFIPLGEPGTDQCDDWGAWKALLEAGAKFSHLPERTWRWHGHPHHTSGRKWQEVYG